MPVEQTEEEFKNHLRRQIGFLQRSVKFFDEGCTDEALHMAVAIRIIMYDNKRSGCISLLSSLRKKDIKFYDTTLTLQEPIHPTFTVQLGLGGKFFSDVEPKYITPFNERPFTSSDKTDFLHWWKGIFIEDKMGSKFSRADLIYHVCNKDGGAHVDPELDDDYAALSRSNTMGMVCCVSSGPVKHAEGVELACIRQIGEEVILTLKDEFPELF